MYLCVLEMNSLTKKNDFFSWFYLHTVKPPLLSDNIQGNTVEKDFQILSKLNFINIYTIVRGKDWTKIWYKYLID